MNETGKIKRNAIKCAHCGFILESTSVHDYRTHHCEKAPPVEEKKWAGMELVTTGKLRPPMIMVDGGKEYLRRGYDRKEDYIEISEYEKD